VSNNQCKPPEVGGEKNSCSGDVKKLHEEHLTYGKKKTSRPRTKDQSDIEQLSGSKEGKATAQRSELKKEWKGPQPKGGEGKTISKKAPVVCCLKEGTMYTLDAKTTPEQ